MGSQSSRLSAGLAGLLIACSAAGPTGPVAPCFETEATIVEEPYQTIRREWLAALEWETRPDHAMLNRITGDLVIEGTRGLYPYPVALQIVANINSSGPYALGGSSTGHAFIGWGSPDAPVQQGGWPFYRTTAIDTGNVVITALSLDDNSIAGTFAFSATDDGGGHATVLGSFGGCLVYTEQR